MHSTFLHLFFSSCALAGSNFWLSTSIFLSSCFTFLFTLQLCRFFGIPLDPIALTEALPFLVCTVGFGKPLHLAREVMKHEYIFTPLPSSSLRPAVSGQPQHISMKPAGEVVLEALDRAGNSIVRDYALEIAVMLVGAYSRVGGLKEFCALASLAMTLDCVMLGTFYTAVLTVMVGVRRIKMVRTLKKEQELNSAIGAFKPPEHSAEHALNTSLNTGLNTVLRLPNRDICHGNSDPKMGFIDPLRCFLSIPAVIL
ncbi:3-hydroxy-3-methylglutaryl-coenzyme A reductase [Cerrena zonata]|uniref:3-hydroxy-3-methylglutaryl-coenzyme A reductase n=1 Tax=Cerrena zonata TaxID=2478898 RepID=A0AAW0FYX2_9APHY